MVINRYLLLKTLTLFQHKLVIEPKQGTTKFALAMKSPDQQCGPLHVLRRFPNVLELNSRPFHGIFFLDNTVLCLKKALSIIYIHLISAPSNN